MVQAFKAAFSPGATPYFYILWGIFVGILLATAIITVYKVLVGRLVKALKRTAASSPETAKTLVELGFSTRSPLRFFLRKGSTLRKIVHRVGDVPSETPTPAAEAVPTDAPTSETDATTSENTENSPTLPTVEPEKSPANAQTVAPKGGNAAANAPTPATDSAADSTTASIPDPTAAVPTVSTQEPTALPAAYYLPEEQADRATALFDRHDLNPVVLALTPVALFAILIGLFWVLPYLT